MSYATALAAVTGITVTGVKRTYTYPPSQVSTADMPCLFPAIPTGTHVLGTLGGVYGLDQYEISLVLLIEPSAQSTNALRFAKATEMLDVLVPALKAVASVMQFTVRMDTVALDVDSGTTYTALVAAVTVSG